MAELESIEVIMRIDFAAQNGTEVIAHAERVRDLVRCYDCIHRGQGECPMTYEEYFDEWPDSDWIRNDMTEDCGFCHKGERR